MLRTDPEPVSPPGPTEEYETNAEVDPCVGGKHRIEMKRSGNAHTAIGEYREVEPAVEARLHLVVGGRHARRYASHRGVQ